MSDAPHDPRRSGEPEEFGSGPHYPSPHDPSPHSHAPYDPSPYEAAPPGPVGHDHSRHPGQDPGQEPRYPTPHDPHADWSRHPSPKPQGHSAVPSGGGPGDSAGQPAGYGYGYAPGQPTWGGYVPAPTPPTGLGVTSMVFGIIALLLSVLPLIGLLSLLLGPLAVILGIIAIMRRNGRGFGIAGLITGALGTAISLAVHIISGIFITAIFEEVDLLQENLVEDADQHEEGPLEPAEDDGGGPADLLPQDVLDDIEQQIEDADADDVRQLLEQWGGEIDEEELERLQRELEQQLSGD
ncbi:hypothetical protein [Nesterenkonia sp. K-15-9-6]|uniref:hypothetical protein n=1 Tax=Nesterenkonia sp. K-15-9-6 TaxID=3093918 RepID=UPI004043A80D